MSEPKIDLSKPLVYVDKENCTVREVLSVVEKIFYVIQVKESSGRILPRVIDPTTGQNVVCSSFRLENIPEVAVAYRNTYYHISDKEFCTFYHPSKAKAEASVSPNGVSGYRIISIAEKIEVEI